MFMVILAVFDFLRLLFFVPGGATDPQKGGDLQEVY
jgi:hypothetical protein